MHVQTVCTIVLLWGENYLEKKEENIISIHDKEKNEKKKIEKNYLIHNNFTYCQSYEYLWRLIISWRKGSHIKQVYSLKETYMIFCYSSQHTERRIRMTIPICGLFQCLHSLKPSQIFTALVDPCSVTIRLHSLI